jgi:hypothetical protein
MRNKLKSIYTRWSAVPRIEAVLSKRFVTPRIDSALSRWSEALLLHMPRPGAPSVYSLLRSTHLLGLLTPAHLCVIHKADSRSVLKLLKWASDKHRPLIRSLGDPSNSTPMSRCYIVTEAGRRKIEGRMGIAVARRRLSRRLKSAVCDRWLRARAVNRIYVVLALVVFGYICDCLYYAKLLAIPSALLYLYWAGLGISFVCGSRITKLLAQASASLLARASALTRKARTALSTRAADALPAGDNIHRYHYSLRGDSSFHGTCSCGWVSKKRMEDEPTEQEFREHVIESTGHARYYRAPAVCTNCSFRGLVRVFRGLHLRTSRCPRCDVYGHLRSQEEYDRDRRRTVYEFAPPIRRLHT